MPPGTPFYSGFLFSTESRPCGEGRRAGRWSRLDACCVELKCVWTTSEILSKLTTSPSPPTPSLRAKRRSPMDAFLDIFPTFLSRPPCPPLDSDGDPFF